MKWEMISAIGQVLGAIGVIISLVYLAIQIRRQKRESRTAAMNTLVSHFSDVMISPVENVDFCALWMRGPALF